MKERIKHELQSAVNQKTYQSDIKLSADYEKELLESRLETQRESLNKLQHFKLQVQTRIVTPILNKSDSVKIPEMCRELHTRYPEEYSTHKISLLAVKLIGAHLIKPYLSEWDLKSNPKHLYTRYLDIGDILSIEEDQSHPHHEDEYALNARHITNELMSDAAYDNEDVLYYMYDTYWLHRVRAYISTTWDVKAHSLAFFEGLRDWSYLMPGRFLGKVVNLYLKPRLLREISSNWDPKDLTEENKLENWLLIWSELLGPSNMQVIFVAAKLKIYQALNDCSDVELAKALLLPWKGAIEPLAFDNMVVRVVVPRITLSLKTMEIDPGN